MVMMFSTSFLCSASLVSNVLRFANVLQVTALTWDQVYAVCHICVVCVCLLPIHSFTVPSSFRTISVSRKDMELSLSSSHVNFMLPNVSVLSHLYISKSEYAIGCL